MILISLPCFLVAQRTLTPSNDISVSYNNNVLTNAWAGGINNAQVSNIDVNNDYQPDLFIFDRARNSFSVFINDNGNFHFAPAYCDSFPQMTSWALLLDYNNDGKADIFTSNSTLIQNASSFRVYKNVSTDHLQFNLIDSDIKTDYYGTNASLYITGTDIPAFTDVDGDTDIDVVTFDVTGGALEFHKNRSIELNGNSDGLIFKLTNACWGNVREDPSSSALSLGITCTPITNKTELHSGSTLLLLDKDGDNDKDLIVGDLLFNSLTLAINGGNASSADLTSQDIVFPSNSTAVNVRSFPAAFYANTDNDLKRDLIASPNSKTEEDYFVMHLYKNNGTDQAPIFDYQQNNFLVNSMLDFGTNTYPVFFDYNSDGLQDILVANDGIYDNLNSKKVGKIALLVNTGISTNPQYTLQNTDLSTLSQYNITSMKPTFGDMDNDGDMDMLIGSMNGQVHYFKNTAGVGNTCNFVIETPIYQSIDVGNYSTPVLFDLDEDGLLDLIIGEQDGVLNYYKNTGSSANPIFTLQTNKLSNIDVSENFLSGYSVPFFYHDQQNKINLLVGTFTGKIQHYNNIEGNLNGNFSLVTNAFEFINEGIQSAPAMANLYGDNNRVLLVGSKSGGLFLFDEKDKPNFITNILKSNLKQNHFENHLNITGETNIVLKEVIIYNILGEEILHNQLNGNQSSISTENIANGCYISRVQYSENGNTQYSQFKFVK